MIYYNDDVARLIPGIEKWLYNMPSPPTLDITHVVNIYMKNEYKYIHTTLEYVLYIKKDFLNILPNV